MQQLVRLVDCTCRLHTWGLIYQAHTDILDTQTSTHTGVGRKKKHAAVDNGWSPRTRMMIIAVTQTLWKTPSAPTWKMLNEGIFSKSEANNANFDEQKELLY